MHPANEPVASRYNGNDHQLQRPGADYRHRRRDLNELLQPASHAGAEDVCELFV